MSTIEMLCDGDNPFRAWSRKYVYTDNMEVLAEMNNSCARQAGYQAAILSPTLKGMSVEELVKCAKSHIASGYEHDLGMAQGIFDLARGKENVPREGQTSKKHSQQRQTSNLC